MNTSTTDIDEVEMVIKPNGSTRRTSKDEQQSLNERPTSRGPTKAPEGGWAWFIVLSAFINAAFLDGLGASLGVLLVTLKTYFNEGAGRVSLISSLGLFVFHSSGPISGSICEYAGEKKVTMIGAFICCAGLFMSGFMPNVTLLYLTIGFLMNFGLSLSYLPTFALLGKHFQKRHGLVNGLGYSGYGLGVMGLPPLCQLLIERYGWQGTVIILSGMCGNLFVAAAFLRLQIPMAKSNRENDTDSAKRGRLCMRLTRLLGFHIICMKPGMIGLLLAVGCTGASYGIFVTFFMQRADEIRIERMDASLLITAFGAASFLMRLVHGWFIDLRIVSPVCVLIGSITTWSALLLAFVFVTNYWGVMTLSVLLGLASGLTNSLPFVVFKDAIGRKHVASAFGLCLVSIGLGSLIGITIAGALYDMTGTSDVTFYSAAAWGFLHSVILTTTKIFGNVTPKADHDRRWRADDSQRQ
ncbi:monocarboxylate transporter 13-like [Ptychodera flava]|uniref:monocarboxylate transporter 13-like n=1 Tax=Ptychodera flava TaxID=63121 RepID=UPI003969E0BE